jgi:predicted metal-dependent hydrolase
MSVVEKYISGHSPELILRVQTLVDQNRLGPWLLGRYPVPHGISNDKDLREMVLVYKNRYLKNSGPLSKVVYDKSIRISDNALGLHSFVTRSQGAKLKRKNEIRISSVLKKAPQELLEMVVVHELAHLKEKDHNKVFYQLCSHMLADYHQLEFDMYLYLIHLETCGPLYVGK